MVAVVGIANRCGLRIKAVIETNLIRVPYSGLISKGENFGVFVNFALSLKF